MNLSIGLACRPERPRPRYRAGQGRRIAAMLGVGGGMVV